MEIVRGVHQVDGIIGNSYIINGKKMVVIDTGLPGNSRKIINYIRVGLKRSPNDVTTIILTHYHAGHSGNVYELKNLTGAIIAIHADDADYVSGKKEMPAGRTPIQHVTPDTLLQDGDKIAGLTCVHCPGHTAGSVALYDPNRRILFSGDTLGFDEGHVHGPREEFSEDMKLVKNSIISLSGLDYDLMLPGHGSPLKPDAAVRVSEFSRTIP
jgi:glyoxylase-like metal-dependent hydrolase (beta-lactamase superfamily II)